MGKGDNAAIQAHAGHRPGLVSQASLEVLPQAVVQLDTADQAAAAASRAPHQSIPQTPAAQFPGGILHAATVATVLQGQRHRQVGGIERGAERGALLGRAGALAQRGPVQLQPALHGGRGTHRSLLARIAAAEHSPRS